jgi:hypothetical protein
MKEYREEAGRGRPGSSSDTDFSAGKRPLTEGLGVVQKKDEPGTSPAPTGTSPAPTGPAPAPEPRKEQTEYGTFFVYPDSFVGPLPPNGPDGERVHEKDFHRIVKEREAAATAKREQAVKKVDKLLSYGAFDWAITDGEATEALNTLATIEPMSQLQSACQKINAGRLLDNLPAKARKTPQFARVIIAMGPSRYRPFVNELLSYGVLDWAIRDAEVQVVTDILTVLPAPQRITFLRSLDATHLSRLARNLGSGVHTSNEILKNIFDVQPNSDLAAMEAVFEKRFNISLSTWFLKRWLMSVKDKWDAPGLRRLWQIFEMLPPGHIQDNPRLDTFLRAGKTAGSGVYYGDFDAGVVEYGNVNETANYGQIMVDDGAGGKKDASLNTGINAFDTVVRHEVGHSVDAKIGASKEGGYVHTAANAGEWKSYGSGDAFVEAIITSGGGMTGHGYTNPEAYKEAMKRAVNKGEDFTTALHKFAPSVAAPAAPGTGPIAAVWERKLWHPDDSPWYKAADRQDVGGRLWQRPYGGGDYVSFKKDARISHGVSGYQFRAPGEWFAEAYAVYYSDQDTGTHVGTRLRTRDTAAADWFDTNVDKGYSLAHEKGGAGGGAGGGASGGVARGPGGGTRSGGAG